MLPGFRFLIAAVVLCLSLLVFGFGATALLRSAREDVASLPVRRVAPQTAFASHPLPEPAPTLSMLRVEAPEIRPSAPAAELPVVPQENPAPASPEPEQQALLSPAAPAVGLPSATPAPSPATENVVPVEAMAAPAAPAPAAASVEIIVDVPAIVAAIAPASAADQPVSTLTEADTQIAVMNVATLGGPAVDIEPVPLPKAKPAKREKAAEPAPKKKKARAEDKPKRRRLEARAETPAPAAAAAPADTFGWQQPPR
jgi:hypothetical protein